MSDFLLSVRRVRRQNFDAEPGRTKFLEVPDDNETNTAPCISEVEFRYYVNWRMDLARGISESYDSSIG